MFNHHPGTFNGRGRGRFLHNGYNFQNNEHTNTGTKEFWCETCDRDFKTLSLLEEHLKQHQKCNIDGCQFVAHPKIITKHIQMQHASGLFKKIAKLADPEEVKKWREERKLKYPTKINIDKKNAEIREKITRGEKMALKRKHEFNDKHGKNAHRQDNTKNNNKNNFRNRTKVDYKHRDVKPMKIPRPETVIETEKIKLKPFAGIQDLVFDDLDKETDDLEETCNVTDDEDEYHVNGPFKTHIEKPSVCGALSSLMCDYESSEDENTKPNTTDKQNKIEKINNNVVDAYSQNPSNVNSEVSIVENKFNSDNDSGPEEVKVARPSGEEPTPLVAEKYEEKFKPYPVRKKIKIPKKIKPKLPSTLLSKLLAKEINHERNVILQCVRHIVKNNYFDSQ